MFNPDVSIGAAGSKERIELVEGIVQFAEENFPAKPTVIKEKQTMLKKIVCFFVGHYPKLFRSGNIRCLRCWKMLESVKKEN